jgi:hypothetical protein
VGNPDTTVVSGKCYRYRFRISDRVGNQATSNVTAEAKVDTVAPTLSELTITAANAAYLTGTTLFWGTPTTTKSFQFVTAVADAESGSAYVTYPAMTASGWTHAAETVTGSSPYTSTAYTWTTSAANPTGYNITLSDAAGNTAVQAITFSKDTTAPSGSDIQSSNSGATVGRPEPSDTITFTFSEQMSPGSILTGWTGASTTVTVRLSRTGNNGPVILTVWNAGNSAPLNLGSVDLKQRDYFAGNGSKNAAITGSTMVQSGSTIIVTLGATFSGDPVATAANSSAMTWTPSTSARDLAGNAMSATAVNESGAADKEF